MKTHDSSAGTSGEDSGDKRTLSSLLRQLVTEAHQWLSDGKKQMLAGDFNTALAFFRNGLAKAQFAGESELEAELHNSCGCMLAKLGDKPGAKGHHASAVAILERLFVSGPNEPDALFFSRYNLNEIQRQIHADAVSKKLIEATRLLQEGMLLKSRHLIEETLPLAEHGAKDPILRAQLLNQLAFTYARERNQVKDKGLRTALSLFEQALILVDDLADTNDTAREVARIVDKNIEHFDDELRESPVWKLIEESEGFIGMNNFEHGEAAATRAAQVCRKKLGADHAAMAHAYNRIGFCLLMMQDFEGARKYLRAAKVLISKWPEYRREARTIGFSLLWAESEAEGRSEWDNLPPDWQ